MKIVNFVYTSHLSNSRRGTLKVIDHGLVNISIGGGEVDAIVTYMTMQNGQSDFGVTVSCVDSPLLMKLFTYNFKWFPNRRPLQASPDVTPTVVTVPYPKVGFAGDLEEVLYRETMKRIASLISKGYMDLASEAKLARRLGKYLAMGFEDLGSH